MAFEGKGGGFSNFEASREEIVRVHFEPQLARLGLSVEQIEGQTLEELNESLVKVNDAIAHPEAFGTLKISAAAGGGFVIAKTEAHFEIGILPMLLERKSLILSRIKSLVGERRIDSLKDLGSGPITG